MGALSPPNHGQNFSHSLSNLPLSRCFSAPVNFLTNLFMSNSILQPYQTPFFHMQSLLLLLHHSAKLNRKDSRKYLHRFYACLQVGSKGCRTKGRLALEIDDELHTIVVYRSKGIPVDSILFFASDCCSLVIVLVLFLAELS